MNHFVFFLRKVPRIPHRIYWEMRKWVFPVPLIIRLWWNNRWHCAPITQSGGPVLSMTTYGRRLRTVYLAIESIARGSISPSRIILWLDDEKLFKTLPASIYRLIWRDLEVKLCENYGPHTKYYPYIASKESFQEPLVTADDDVLYPSWWLARLLEAYREYPHVINCHWAVVMDFENGIAPYKSWKRNGYVEPSFSQIALGVSGVIYPPAMQAALKKARSAFEDCCPKADDLWLHVQAIRSGFKVRQVRAKRLICLEIPGSQRIALWHQNDQGGYNDRQIATTYTAEDIQIMLNE